MNTPEGGFHVEEATENDGASNNNDAHVVHCPSPSSSSSSLNGGGDDDEQRRRMKPVQLTDIQNNDLQLIWTTHAPDATDDISLAMGGSNATQLTPELDDTTYIYIARLTIFFLDIVRSYRSRHPRHHNANHDINILVPCIDHTLRESLCRLFFHESHVSKQSSNDELVDARPLMVRLWESRKVFHFSYNAFHDSFISHEEARAGGPLSVTAQPQLRGFLYHHPHMALAGIASALSLTMATLWRQQHVPVGVSTILPQNQQHVQQSLQRLERALGKALFIVQFTETDQIIPMGHIKAGLRNKFISIQGHVLKARPKRLRLRIGHFRCEKCHAHFPWKFIDGKYNVPDRCQSTTGAGNCRSKTFTILRSTATYIDIQELLLQEVNGGNDGNDTSNVSSYNNQRRGDGAAAAQVNHSSTTTTRDSDDTQDVGSRTPRQMNVEVTEDLVDSCCAGDVVRVVGIVKSISTALAAGRTGRRALETSTYKLFLSANCVVNTSTDEYHSTTPTENGRRQSDLGNNSSKRRKIISSRNPGLTFSPEQLETIRKIAHADHRIGTMAMRQAFPFDLLVHSLCPSIIGHELVKASLLLGLLGGTPAQSRGTKGGSSSNNNNVNAVRSNSHVLIVGDPGMGKSQMLLAVNQIASRSVYVGGNTSTTTGLTVSLTKEAGGEVGIEAGALVLADRGICCIDEFDKMAKSNQDGLLEAMEQQQISIAKAGVVATLPARCSILAAANPEKGLYDKGKSVKENLNISGPLLSRFDLVFILQDNVNKHQDNQISSSIMNLYRDNHQHNHGSSTTTTRSGNPSNTTSGGTSVAPSQYQLPLDPPERMHERLRWVTSFQKETLPLNVLRDYISYAKEYCKPKLTRYAANELKQYFMEIRYGAHAHQDVAITTRQLEALIRLSQARAKAALRDYVLREDALDVIDLMRHSVMDVHVDQNGVVDRSRGGAGGTSQKKLITQFTNALQRLMDQRHVTSVTMNELRQVADQTKVPLTGFKDFIDKLRDKDVLLKNKDGSFTLAN